MAEKATKTSEDQSSCKENVQVARKSNWIQKIDLWWKIVITVALVSVIIFVVYKTVHDEKHRSARKPLKTQSKRKVVTEVPANNRGNITKCTEGSIKNSYATFTFIPTIGSKPYQTNGLEFSFEEVAKKLESHLVKFNHILASTSRIHYYFNIDRCRIGGDIKIDKKPYIRGPMVFAANQECSKVYFFSESKGRWVNYISATSISCSHHGIQYCIQGGSHHRWIYTQNKITAIEFEFNILDEKLQNYNLKPIIDNNKEFHYFLNLKTCPSTDLITPGSSPLVIAVNNNCTISYSFHNSTWHKKTESVSCSWKNNSWCQNDAGENASFQFTSHDSKKPKVIGIQFTLPALLHKLHGLIIEQDELTKLKTINSPDTRYYLNLKRCLNGGLTDNSSRGPLYFAITNNCTKVHYFSTNQWKKYNSAFNILCN